MRFMNQRQYDPMTMLMAGTAIISGGSSILGGIQANKAAKQEAALQRQQGEIAYQEAQINANNEAFNQTQAVQRQRLAFLSSGVSLEGSPLAVLQQSREYGQSQVDAILRQGANTKILADAQANITKNKGRAALISGVASGVGSLAKAGYDLNKAGAFDSKPVNGVKTDKA